MNTYDLSESLTMRRPRRSLRPARTASTSSSLTLAALIVSEFERGSAGPAAGVVVYSSPRERLDGASVSKTTCVVRCAAAGSGSEWRMAPLVTVADAAAFLSIDLTAVTQYAWS